MCLTIGLFEDSLFRVLMFRTQALLSDLPVCTASETHRRISRANSFTRGTRAVLLLAADQVDQGAYALDGFRCFSRRKMSFSFCFI